MADDHNDPMTGWDGQPPPSALDHRQLYQLDVEGYLVINAALTDAEVAAGASVVAGAAAAGAAGLAAVAELPAVLKWVGAAFESGALNIPGVVDAGNAFQLDSAPAALPSPPVGQSAAADFAGQAAHDVDGARLCYGVTAFAALADNLGAAGGVTVVPSSHKSALAAPDLSADEMGVTMAVPLRAGDLLIAAATLLLSGHGRPASVIRLEYTPKGSFPSAGIPPPAALRPAPGWLDELSAEQLAVVGARTVGLQAAGSSPKVVMSDGSQTWTEPRPAFDTPRGNPGLQPPSIFKRHHNPQVDPRELWFFDTRGYLVIKGVMDPEWLARANTGQL